ncbi:hypothetical protein JANAI62_21080 [Jannaschia pagri]|uniref:Hemerythrin-like domain-containing protein n=1 Tax=Jannaschia pagri TaxID=2829797 RepID=A0ABQ4NM40_9RHOB|nr:MULTISPECIES: hemerythrin domain-containing protein [unclassified Jannaschia]GIT91651.1 hypothetical protein JANAI61_21090 [Jannaschia sp. AI_61]GIT95485.1 hypothetical protein JANAI62_21080 [Jannaschia sp. AI_62]
MVHNGTNSRFPSVRLPDDGPISPEAWSQRPAFGDLTRFWLSRHQMFRDLMSDLRARLRACEGGDLDPTDPDTALHRDGRFLCQEMLGHHGVEDSVYFPRLIVLQPSIAPWIERLHSDHQDIGCSLDRLSQSLSQVRDGARAVALVSSRLTAVMELKLRHMQAEEETVVPVILTLGEDQLR